MTRPQSITLPTKHLASMIAGSDVKASVSLEDTLSSFANRQYFRAQVSHNRQALGALPVPVPAQQRGFTLIEVMVALAILAVVAVAASQASAGYLRSVEILKTRTLAHFVAQNAAADLQVNKIWLTGDQSKRVSEQGRDWQVLMSASKTMTPVVNKITINVAPIEDGVVKNSVTDLTVMISDPKATEASGSMGMSLAGTQ